MEKEINLDLAKTYKLEQMANAADRLNRPYPFEEKYFEGEVFQGDLYRSDLIEFIEEQDKTREL